MAPPSLSTAMPQRPDDRTIAFAISIVLSKPEDVSIREYIRLLRRHVAKGRRENALSSVYRHLDRSAFWRSEYERVKNRLKAAEAETTDLRREVEVLRAKGECSKASRRAPKKRKKLDEDVVPVFRETKKTSKDSSPTGDVPLETDFEFVDLGETGTILMRCLFQVHSSLKAKHRTEPDILACHLVRSASALPPVVQQTVEQCSKRFITGSEMLKTNLTAAGRVACFLIVGINRLGQISGGEELQGQVIYAYVHMFAKLLNTFHEASEVEAKRWRTSDNASSIEKQPSTAKSKSKVIPRQVGNLKESQTLNAITAFLCSFIDQLDPKRDVCKSLFEGFIYCALQELGNRLYLCVFGHARAESIDSEIMMSNRTDELDEASSAQANKPDLLEVEKAKLEAPYLIRLFTRFMSSAPAHLGSMISKKTGKPKTANNKGSMKGVLAITAKDRLQRTLVDCIFGIQESGEDAELRDCLKMPGLGQGKKLEIPRIKETEVQEWFKEEMWRLLGWEILAKEWARE